jgi:hypothetical protein
VARIPLAEMDALAAEIREQIGDCPKCGGPGDGTCCDHE